MYVSKSQHIICILRTNYVHNLNHGIIDCLKKDDLRNVYNNQLCINLYHHIIKIFLNLVKEYNLKLKYHKCVMQKIFLNFKKISRIFFKVKILGNIFPCLLN